MAEEYLPPLLTEKQHQRLREVLDMSIEGDGSIRVDRQPGTHRYRILDMRGQKSRPPTLYPEETQVISGLVTSNASGKGKYNGKSFTNRTTDVLGTGDLAESDFGDLSSEEDCLILNPVELGSSETGHDVTHVNNTSKFAIYFTGRLARVNSDGKKVVHAMLFYVGMAEPA